MSIVDELKDLAKAIVIKGSGVVATMDEISKWDSIEEITANVKTLQEFFGDVAAAVKEAAEKLKETVTNEEKLDAAVGAVMDLVELPAMVELGLSMFLKYAISAAYQQYVKK